MAATAINEVRYSDRVDWDSEDSILTGMTSIAICGIEDPVRPEVGGVFKTTIAICGIEDPVRPEVGRVSLRLVPNQSFIR